MIKEITEARYFYLPNGMLSRVETGQKQIQGTDYAYTLQGWLKDINGYRTDTVNRGEYDIGRDAACCVAANNTNPNRHFAADAFATMLQYYKGDYRPIAGNNIENLTANSAIDLFNGNISAISSNTYGNAPMLKAFRYDKLNRIKQMQTATLSDNNWGNLSHNFATAYTYDFNGNITSLHRNTETAQPLHNIDYQYNNDNNRLQSIHTSPTLNSQLLTLNSSYDYDPIGNLTDDHGDSLQITWNATGKVKTVFKENEDRLIFSYTPTGQRQIKTIHSPVPQAYPPIYTTEKYYYIHDATGNVMCIYKVPFVSNKIVVKERPIYGSKRLGILTQSLTLSNNGNVLSFDTNTIGTRTYELTDHFGNVMATVLDRKILGADSVYRPVVVSCTDYYPFGFPMSERSASLDGYRYGFNGQESDNEFYAEKQLYTAEFWQYDSRLGRRWNVDPKPNTMISPYACFAGNPIMFRDALGDTIIPTGHKNFIRKFVRQLSSSTGNKYGIDKNGYLFNKDKSSNIATTDKKSGELSKIVGFAMVDQEIFDIPLVKNDPNTLIDSYDKGTVDIGDFSKMSRIMQAAAFTHLFAERMENPGDYSPKNRTTENYKVSHNLALEAESRVVNAMIGQPYIKVFQSDIPIKINNVESPKYPGYFIGTTQYGNVKFQFKYSSTSMGFPGGVIYGRYKQIK